MGDHAKEPVTWGTRGRGSLLTLAQKRDLEKKARKLPWEAKELSRVERVVEFLEFLPVTKGILAGQSMKLLPDQREFIEEVYGPTKLDGRRLRAIAIKSAPKGNGKSGLCAGLALCHLLGPEAEVRGEIYSASMDRHHAGKLYAEMEAIVLRIPEFAVRVNVSRSHKSMEVLSGKGAGSTFEALSSDARKANGLSPTLWIYDELAQAKDRVLLDNLIEGMGKRSECLGIIISTQAPDDLHPLSQLIDDALTGADPSNYCHLIAAPKDASAFDLEVLKSVNPAWGIYLDLDDLMRSRNRAQRLPTFEPAFRNLRLNQRVGLGDETRIMSAAVWAECAGRLDLERLRGRKCFGGLDLSGKHDLTALVLVFPNDEREPAYDVLPFFWTPLGAMEARARAEHDLFDLWIRQGYINSVSAPVIKARYMAAQLRELRATYEIQAIGYDRWRIDEFKVDLSDEDAANLPLAPFGQGFKDMGPAVDLFAEVALSGRLRHGNHPVLTACVVNAITVSDAAGNLKVDKQKSNRPGMTRVDGAVALAIALGTAKRFAPAPVVDFMAMIG